MSFPRNGRLPTRGRLGGPGGNRPCFFFLLNDKEINVKFPPTGAIVVEVHITDLSVIISSL